MLSRTYDDALIYQMSGCQRYQYGHPHLESKTLTNFHGNRLKKFHQSLTLWFDVKAKASPGEDIEATLPSQHISEYEELPEQAGFQIKSSGAVLEERLPSCSASTIYYRTIGDKNKSIRQSARSQQSACQNKLR